MFGGPLRVVQPVPDHDGLGACRDPETLENAADHRGLPVAAGGAVGATDQREVLVQALMGQEPPSRQLRLEIGRASCRERVWASGGTAVGKNKKREDDRAT